MRTRIVSEEGLLPDYTRPAIIATLALAGIDKLEGYWSQSKDVYHMS